MKPQTKPKMKALVLAAGQSQRMGQAKQLMLWQGQSLLERACCSLLSLDLDLYVLLGAHASECQALIQSQPALAKAFTPIICPHYALGMGASLAYGLQQLGTDAPVLLHLVDLPLVDHAYMKSLIQAFEQDQEKVLLSDYQGLWAPPAILPIPVLPQCQEWSGDKGLGAYWKQHPDWLRFHASPMPFMDLDRPEDLQALNAWQKSHGFV